MEQQISRINDLLTSHVWEPQPTTIWWGLTGQPTGFMTTRNGHHQMLGQTKPSWSDRTHTQLNRVTQSFKASSVQKCHQHNPLWVDLHLYQHWEVLW